MRDSKGREPLTAAEIGVVVGVPAATVRQWVRRHNIKAVGRNGKAKLYWMHEIARHVGAHDRRNKDRAPPRVSH